MEWGRWLWPLRGPRAAGLLGGGREGLGRVHRVWMRNHSLAPGILESQRVCEYISALLGDLQNIRRYTTHCDGTARGGKVQGCRGAGSIRTLAEPPPAAYPDWGFVRGEMARIAWAREGIGLTV